MKFGTILCDLPWEYDYRGSPSGVPGRVGRQGQARDRYETQGMDWMLNLPVEDVAAEHCTLLLWATWPKLREAMQVIEAWNFTYKTGLPWVKMSRAAAPRVGIGYHAQSCSEMILIATKGSPGVPPMGERPLGIIFNPIGEHSAKPEQQYLLAEGYRPPWLEMFHRPRGGGLFPPREGWVMTGREVDGLDMREALLRLAQAEELECAA